MEINVEHILDCLDQYGKGELTEEQLVKALTYDEKMFLIMHQGLLGEIATVKTTLMYKTG